MSFQSCTKGPEISEVVELKEITSPIQVVTEIPAFIEWILLFSLICCEEVSSASHV